MFTRIAKIIKAANYEGIRDQDGWETVSLTVEATENSADAEIILTALSMDVARIMEKAWSAAFLVLDNKWYRMDCTINEDEEKMIYFHDEETYDEMIFDLMDEDDIADAKTAVFYSVNRIE